MTSKTPTLKFGDTFLYPKFKEGDGIKQFDVVLANPPWNQDGYDEEVLKKAEFWKQRFSFGFVPRQSADWAWIEHMLASAKDNGSRVGIVIDNGCLFRGGKEKVIRSAVLSEKHDLIESVILLPEKLFYNTVRTRSHHNLQPTQTSRTQRQSPFHKRFQRSRTTPRNTQTKQTRRRQHEENCRCIQELQRRKRLLANSPIEEIENQNDSSLNVTLYVMQDEENEGINIAQEYTELEELEETKTRSCQKTWRYTFLK